MEWSGKCCLWLRRLPAFLLALVLAADSLPVPAAGTDPFADALAFYETFGANRMVPEKDALWFCTRGKLAAGSETTYRTLGYTIRLRNNEGSYQIKAVIGESIRVESRRTRQEGALFEYTLCCFDGSMLFKRLKLACPVESFQWFFRQGRQNTLLADAIMTLAKNGVPMGSVSENDRGSVEETGLLFRDEASIRAAAAWDPDNDFSSEFHILLTMTMEGIFPPVLIRTVDLASLALLPEQSLWAGGRPRALLETSLRSETALEERRLPAEERRRRPQ